MLQSTATPILSNFYRTGSGDLKVFLNVETGNLEFYGDKYVYAEHFFQ
jgi:hypothetical protein